MTKYKLTDPNDLNSSQITLISYQNESGENLLPDQANARSDDQRGCDNGGFEGDDNKNGHIQQPNEPDRNIDEPEGKKKPSDESTFVDVSLVNEITPKCQCQSGGNDKKVRRISRIGETLSRCNSGYDAKKREITFSYNGNNGAPDAEKFPPPIDSKLTHCRSMSYLTRPFKRKLLHKRVPVLEWFPKYNSEKALMDFVAGCTVGLTVMPQAIAYASVAGVPPEVGLYSSFMACFVYTIFGSCKYSAVGMSAMAAILTNQYGSQISLDASVLLTLLTGCVALMMGILQLGFLIDFISGPVSVGFTSAAAIIIATSQVKDVLGMPITNKKFLSIWEEVIENIDKASLNDAALGFTCMTVLFILRKIKDWPIGTEGKERTSFQNYLCKVLWLLSTARNIVVVVFCSVMCYIFYQHDMTPFILTGYVKGGLPQVKPPPFQTTVNNETWNFWDITSNIGSGLFILPLITILEDVSLAKVFANGEAVDASQEMIAIGLCNIASSFVGSVPVTGSLSRGAVNHASGAQTTFSGIYTGLIVLISLKFFTPYFFFIPKASLAAVIIAAVVFMVEFNVVKPIWRTKKFDLIPAMATFLSCLFIRLELGVMIGISINVMFLLYASARPTLKVENLTSLCGYDYLLITPGSSLRFPSVEYVRKSISKAGTKATCRMPVVIDARHVEGVDFTAAEGIKTLIDDFSKREQLIIFFNLKPSIVTIIENLRANIRLCRNEDELNEIFKRFVKV